MITSFNRTYVSIALCSFIATNVLFWSLANLSSTSSYKLGDVSSSVAQAGSVINFGAKTTFSFTLNTDAQTSAGVYKKDGTLIRTLWSGESYKAGKYTRYWDGIDDDGRLVANGDYAIKVLSNNVKYTWEGVIGNTSAEFTGATVHRGHEPMRSMAIAGNTAYYAKGYSESSSSQIKFNLTAPQAMTKLALVSGSSQNSVFTVTDGINVYWAGYDAFSSGGSKWFVFATTARADAEVEFANGNSFKLARGGTYKSSIAVVDDGKSEINGIAVQRKGNYLFVSSKEQNQIQVYNKTTGAEVRMNAIKSPGNICIDNDDNLWIIAGNNTVQKYNVVADGLLVAAPITLTGLAEPLALAVSPRDNLVVVADGGKSQQVKAYDNITGRAVWTYGQEGGYSVNATVSNDKFYFTDAAGRNTRTFITFQQDGSFWVGDTGNSRAMHYGADRTYLNSIMYLPLCYSSFVDANKPERVFADYLEFKVDYSKPLAPDNGSWTLVKNWGAFVPTSLDDKYHRLRGVTTLSNGRTYAYLMKISSQKPTLVELTTSGTVRFTGIEAESQLTQLYPDGSLRRIVRAQLGKSQAVMKRSLTGFDAANNPIWSAEAPMVSTPPATRQDPIFWGNTLKLRTGEVTASNIAISFDGGMPPNGSNGYHLGAIRLGDNKWLWRTAKSTLEGYYGPYPSDGAYDIGNDAKYGGTNALVMDRSIIWGYHGEFWKASQTNKWHHVYDNGLLVGSFGVTGPEVADEEVPAMMAGNAFSPSLVKDDAGNFYLYHNDESRHAGIHRWKITGLSTIQEQSIPVTFTVISGGLTGYYFQSSDLNNLTLRTTRLDPQIDFNWAAKTVPAGTALSDTAEYSVRWQGFLEPTASDEYTLYIKTAKGIRCWVDGTLGIDNWDNAASTELTTKVKLEAGKRYPIRIDAKGGSPVSLQWATTGVSKALIPSRYLSPVTEVDDSLRYDLLNGLTTEGVLKHDLYGWRRSPSEDDYTSKYSDWWQVVTSRKTYRKESPDVWAMFRQPSGVYSVSRDLGIVGKPTSWSLTGRIDYEGNEGNEVTGSGGAYLDVLDKAGKVIARTFVDINYSGRIMRVMGNTEPIATHPQAQMRPIIDQQQPVRISASADGITFTYANYPPVTTQVFDSDSDWRSPKTMRLYFFTNGRNQSRVIGIERMYFSAEPSLPINPTGSGLRVYPNPTQAILNIQHPAPVGKGSISVISTEGRRLSTYEVGSGLTSSVIDVNYLPTGSYLLQYNSDEVSLATRFIKQ